MKVTYERISQDEGFSEGLIISPETEFEKEWIKRHNFPKMYDGKVIVHDQDYKKK